MAEKKSAEDRVADLDKKIKQMQAQKRAILQREKEAARKARTKRLIRIGAEVEAYCGEITDLDAFKDYDLSFCLVPKEPTKPATLLNRFCLTLRLIGSGLAGKKLLMHRPSMESLGRCRSLLCRHQRRADLRQPCVQFLDLLVLYSKLLAFPV